jgi:hypothetical protein
MSDLFLETSPRLAAKTGCPCRFKLHCGGVSVEHFPGNGVCRPAWENRLTVSALMTPTN